MDNPDKVSRRQNVYKLMSDRKWHSTMDINAVGVGGSEGTRRLRELRKKYKIAARRKQGDTSQWEYRLEE